MNAYQALALTKKSHDSVSIEPIISQIKKAIHARAEEGGSHLIIDLHEITNILVTPIILNTIIHRLESEHYQAEAEPHHNRRLKLLSISWGNPTPITPPPVTSPRPDHDTRTAT